MTNKKFHFKISIIGNYGRGRECSCGQTIKVRTVTSALQKEFSEDDILKIDTYGSVQTLLKAPIYAITAMRKSSNVIIFPAHNGVRIFGRMLPLLKTFFRGKKIHYVVIGGWLPEFLKKRPGLRWALKKFDGIYVETSTMKKALEEQGFSNVYVMPNFKRLTALTTDQIVYPTEAPYKLCTFSRVMKEKGIETAANAVKSVNESLGYQAFSLDIYGVVEAEQKDWFEKTKNEFPDYIMYRGYVDADKSVEVLKDYFALLFPTHFYTEGIPGTIIDAYAAGVPVISARWESFSDVVEDGKTGIGYEFDNVDDLKQKLLDIAQDIDKINALKLNSLQKSKQFFPDETIKIIVEQLL